MIYKNGKKVSTLFVEGKKVIEAYSNGKLVYKQSTPTPTTIGEFTVNSNGDKVTFSPGNLQYQASTGLWRFAEHQWDYIGQDNENISSSYSGYIDLFGYGTSGYNNSQNAFKPYSTSTINSDYYSSDLNGTTADWGYAYGQQEGGTWRTLTKDEWYYIINTRSGNRYAKCQIDGQYNCLVVFPDNYSTTLSNINISNSAYNGNALTIQNAEDLTNDGCVILSTVGYRLNVGSINDVGTGGSYWTSSSYNSNNTWRLGFGASSIVTDYYGPCLGMAVRLIQDISN